MSSGVVPNGPWIFNIAKQAHNYSTGMINEFCHEGSPYVLAGQYFDEASLDHGEVGRLYCGMERFRNFRDAGEVMWACTLWAGLILLLFPLDSVRSHKSCDTD